MLRGEIAAACKAGRRGTADGELTEGEATQIALLIAGTVKFTTTAEAPRATLSHHGVVYAAGTARTARGRMSLRLLPPRPGRYTLTLIRGTGRHKRISTGSFTLR